MDKDNLQKPTLGLDSTTVASESTSICTTPPSITKEPAIASTDGPTATSTPSTQNNTLAAQYNSMQQQTLLYPKTPSNTPKAISFADDTLDVSGISEDSTGDDDSYLENDPYTHSTSSHGITKPKARPIIKSLGKPLLQRHITQFACQPAALHSPPSRNNFHVLMSSPPLPNSNNPYANNNSPSGSVHNREDSRNDGRFNTAFDSNDIELLPLESFNTSETDTGVLRNAAMVNSHMLLQGGRTSSHSYYNNFGPNPRSNPRSNLNLKPNTANPFKYFNRHNNSATAVPYVCPIDIYDTVDSGALEVIAAKRSNNPSDFPNNILRPLLSCVGNMNPVNYSKIRSSYRLLYSEFRRGDSSSMAGSSSTRSFILRVFLWMLNLENYILATVKFFKSNRLIIFFMLVDVLVDIVSCMLYLLEIETNAELEKIEIRGRQPTWLWTDRPQWVFETVIVTSVCNMCSLILRLSFSDNRYIAFFSFGTFLDLFISIPFLILTRIPDGRLIYVPYFLRSIVLIPQLKSVLRLRIYWPPINFSSYKEKLIILVTTILVIIFLGMCSFHYFETKFPGESPTTSNLSLMQTFYFIVITISTVGYGDITPKTTLGKFIIISMILLSIVILPGLISDVQENLKLQLSDAGTYTRGNRDFIIICGAFDSVPRVQNVISMVSTRKSSSSTKIVFLARTKQSVQIKAYLNQSFFRNRVTYLQGSGLNMEDLARVQLKYAAAAFILADTNAVNKKEEDEHNTLRAWAFDDYAPHTPLYVDNLLPGTERLQEKTTSASVCIDDLKQILMAYNCLYRGVGTLTVNLLRKCPTYSDYDEPWRAQYADGLSNAIHQTEINPVFIGYPFTIIAYYLFKEFQVILIGVGMIMPSSQGPDGVHVMLNPGLDYILNSTDRCLFIAQSEEDIRAIGTLTKVEFNRTLTQRTLVSSASRHTLSRRPALDGSPTLPSQDEIVLSMLTQGYPFSMYKDDRTPLCWLLRHEQSLMDVVITDASELVSHILVCTYSLSLFRFVCTLRSANLTARELKPILVLCPKIPTPEEFAVFSRFPDLFFMEGDASLQPDLERGNVRASGKVVIVNMQRIPTGESQSSTEDFMDSSSIMVAHLIYNMFHRVGMRKYVVIHLQKRANIKFLRPTARKRRQIRKTRIGALQNHVPLEKDMRDAYNDWIDDVFFAPVFAAGRVLSNSMIEPVLFQSYTNPFILDIYNAFCGVQYLKQRHVQSQLGVERAGLCYVCVPQDFIGKPFGQLFEYFAHDAGVVPIGLLREEIDPSASNKLPFIVTNPLFSLLLKKSDLVYVLATPRQVV
ncbi:hypothetical protein MT418_001655 [Batrachochytrium dendrobatidis]